MEVVKQDILDLNTPALSSTNDLPVVETKPDSTPAPKPEEKTPETPPETKELAAPEVEESAPSDKPDDAAAEPEPKKAKGVQKRIDELLAREREANRRAEAADARLDRALAALEKPGREVKIEGDLEPQKPVKDANNPEAYDDQLTEYVAQKAAWIARREVKAAETENEKKRTDERIAQETRQIQESFKARVDKTKEKYSDYTEVAESPDVEVSIVMASAIAHSEDGPEIAYFLGKNPAEAQRISKLVPQLQLVELGKISERLITPPAKPVSAAPTPGKPIKASSETSKSPEEESMEEYASRRKKALAEERRPGGLRH